MRLNAIVATNFLTAALLLVARSTFAQECADYPYSEGINIEGGPGSTKIIATASSRVASDNVVAISNARAEAAVRANEMMRKFMRKDIKSERAIVDAVGKTKSMQGDAQSASRNDVVRQVQALASSSRALMRKAASLGECYTKAAELRVSVGLEPDAIADASKLQPVSARR